MAVHVDVVLDCDDSERLADFWAAALGYRRFGSAGTYRSIVPPEGESGPKLILQQVDEPKTTKNRVHLDLDVADLDGEVARLEALGATRVSAAPVEEHGMRWVVMADPSGNEFCVCAC